MKQQFVEFDILELGEPLKPFDTKQKYTYFEFNEYSDKELGEMGGCSMQFYIKGQDQKTYLMCGSFEGGAGGEYGTELIWIGIESIRQVEKDNDGDLTFTLMDFPKYLSMMAEPKNIAVIWTKLTDDFEEKDMKTEAIVKSQLA